MLHNELVNIWTHLLGAFIVLFLVFYIALYVRPNFPEIKQEFEIKMNQYFKPIYEGIQNLEYFLFIVC